MNQTLAVEPSAAVRVSVRLSAPAAVFQPAFAPVLAAAAARHLAGEQSRACDLGHTWEQAEQASLQPVCDPWRSAEGAWPGPVVVPGRAGEQRVRVSLRSARFNFRLVSIADEIYTVFAHQALELDAPVGTAIYAADDSGLDAEGGFGEGTELLRLTLDHQDRLLAVD